MTSALNKDIESTEFITISRNEERITPDKSDQIYLVNMDLSKLQSSKKDLIARGSGKMNDSNDLETISLQSFQTLKSIAIKNETNHVEINLMQSEDSLKGKDTHINQTPKSTICNYYLKSELSGSKTKSYLIGNLMISKPNAQIEILFNKKEAKKGGSNSKKQLQNKIVNITAHKIPGLAFTEREVKNGQHNGFQTQRTTPRQIEVKCKHKNKSVSVKKPASQHKDHKKRSIIATVQKIFQALKHKRQDSSSSNNDGDEVTSKNKYNSCCSDRSKRTSGSNEPKRMHLSNKGQKADRCIMSTAKKMNTTTQALFKKVIKGMNKDIHAITPKSISIQKQKASNLTVALKERNLKQNDTKFTRNMIILEVTENEGETQAPKAKGKEKPNDDNKHYVINVIKQRNHSQQHKANNNKIQVKGMNEKAKVTLSKKSSFIKKSFGDSNINTTATNKNISNASNTSRGNLNRTSINQYNSKNSTHCASKRPISLKKDYKTSKPVESIIDQIQTSKQANKNEYISQENAIKSTRKQYLKEGFSLPIHFNSNNNYSKPQTDRRSSKLNPSGVASSVNGILMPAKRSGCYGSNTEKTEQSYIITYETSSSRKNSKEHQCSSYNNKQKTVLKSITNMKLAPHITK